MIIFNFFFSNINNISQLCIICLETPKEKIISQKSKKEDVASPKLLLEDILSGMRKGYTKEVKEQKLEQKFKKLEQQEEWGDKDLVERKIIDNVKLSRVINLKASE